jgi:hypothetical protein
MRIQLVEWDTKAPLLEGHDVIAEPLPCECGNVHIWLGERDSYEPQYRIDMDLEQARMLVEDLRMAIRHIEAGEHIKVEALQ